MNIHFHFSTKSKIILVLVILIGLAITWTIIRNVDRIKRIIFSKDGIILEYYQLSKKIPTPVSKKPSFRGEFAAATIRKPIVTVFPDSFYLSHPNTASPSSLHGKIVFNIENIGNAKALITDINWMIIDNDRRITPPNEWRKIVGETKIGKIYIPAYTGMRYTYGPEITALGKGTMRLSVEVKYQNPYDKKDVIYTAYYSGKLDYDKNVKMEYSSDKFFTIDTK
jgi:hypothetical protein